MQEVILYTFIAGIAGTALGGLLGLKLNLKSKKRFSYILSFSAGMMISIVFFDLIPESIESGSLLLSMSGILAGLLVVLLLDTLLHHQKEDETAAADDLHHHQHALHHNKNRNMLITGMMMIGSVALHNFPEGMAIGSGSLNDAHIGLLMSLMIALHNIPEGMGMIAPLLKGNVKPASALLLTALAGLPTLLGGILGVLLGAVNPGFLSFSLAFAAGSMLYVTFFEILPQVTLLNPGRKPILFCMSGILLGLLFITVLAH